MSALKSSLLAGVLVGLAVLCGCGEGGGASDGTTSTVSADGRCPHEIKSESCPFCNPEMVEAEGFCGAHGFAEALCAECRPFLKVAFRSRGDWCEEHKLPESQCVLCDPDLAQNIRPGEHGITLPQTASDPDAAVCEHGITESKCPFCTPSLIGSEGFCEGHGVAEALCVPCRPFLQAAFVAAGDWCAEHNTPESQCVICNP
ncbi:MAG: cobalt-zinc-cadmium efflux system membrane fusion protein [Phycisphaerales bacterium]|jgi:cobalt-zinc-cadmium efflux system membrane fusion protein